MIIGLTLTTDSYGNVVIDEIGRKVSLPSQPQRIVSLAPNITEILFTLGLEDRIVGVTTYCNYPARAARKPQIGGFINPSLEKIVTLKPDLIIGTADGNRKDAVLQLERIGLSVYTINPTNIQKIFTSILHIGEITGRRDAAKALVAELERKTRHIISVTKNLKKPKIFFQVGIKPLITAGGKTFINEIITIAGGSNIYGKETTNYPHCSLEDVIVKNPDIIIVSSMESKEDFSKTKEKWRRWRQLAAVRNNRIYWIDPDLLNRSSPRIIDGLEQVAKTIHPEIAAN